jgi:hypothetical protein
MKDKICDKKMKFEDCEIAILRNAVDKAQENIGAKIVKSPEVVKILLILENFLKSKKLVCYGGTAINSILPEKDKFYNKNIEIPDYDFFTPNALEDAIELCNIYYKEGFEEVEGKSGVHHGTYKVYVNFIPIADITQLHKDIFTAIKKESINVDGILFAPPNFLRMSMFLELSRPLGDVSRWEKVLKRLILLNNNYPLTGKDCNKMEIQRDMYDKKNEELIFNTVENSLIKQGVVFFGGYALSLYSRYMPNYSKQKLENYPDFDVLSEEPHKISLIIKQRLKDIGINNVKIIKKPAIGEIIAKHYEIIVGEDTILFIYEPLACHSYNTIKIDNNFVKIATIDTMLSFYLAFLYSGRNYYDTNRILCIAQYLFLLQQHNRLKQHGLLKRFTNSCYGHQETIEEIREKKSVKYMELKNKKNTQEFKEYFFKYRPSENLTDKSKGNANEKNKYKNKKTINKRKNKTKTKKRGRGGLFI